MYILTHILGSVSIARPGRRFIPTLKHRYRSFIEGVFSPLKINARFDKLERKVDKVGEDVSDLKTNLARVEAELKGEIKVLEEKVDGMTKRIDA